MSSVSSWLTRPPPRAARLRSLCYIGTRLPLRVCLGVLLDDTHRRLLAGADRDSEPVVGRLVQLETGASELLERLGAIAKTLRRFGKRPRPVHRPTRSDEEVAEVQPFLHVLAQLFLGHVPYIGICLPLRAGLGVVGERRDVLRVKTTPRAVADDASEPCVEEGEKALTVTGVLLDADRVTLGREGLADEPRIGVFAHETPHDRFARADRVGLSSFQSSDA